MSIRSTISVISTVAALSAFGAVVTPSVANAGVANAGGATLTSASMSLDLVFTGWIKDGHWHHPDCGFCTL